MTGKPTAGHANSRLNLSQNFKKPPFAASRMVNKLGSFFYFNVQVRNDWSEGNESLLQFGRMGNVRD